MQHQSEPSEASSAIDAACLFTEQERYDDAIKAFSRIVEQYDQRTIPRAFAHRGRAYYKKDDFEAAINDFNVALSAKPDAPATLYLRACCFYQLKQFKMAADDLRHTLEIKGNQPDARELLLLSIEHL